MSNGKPKNYQASRIKLEITGRGEQTSSQILVAKESADSIGKLLLQR